MRTGVQSTVTRPGSQGGKTRRVRPDLAEADPSVLQHTLKDTLVVLGRVPRHHLSSPSTQIPALLARCQQPTQAVTYRFWVTRIDEDRCPVCLFTNPTDIRG